MKPSEKDLEEAREFVDDWGVYDGPDTAERVAPTFARIRAEGYLAGVKRAWQMADDVAAELIRAGERREAIGATLSAARIDGVAGDAARRALKGDDE